MKAYLPWIDDAGRVSALKTLVFLALFAPFVWVLWGN
jgi:hypothetical protein